MKTLAFYTQKGGGGKTTLAVQIAHALAARGLRVSLADKDPQGASAAWLAGMEGDARVTSLPGALDAPLAALVPARKRAGDAVLVVDCAPSLGGVAQELGAWADLVILPVRPCLLDLRACAASVAMLTKPRKLAVLNQVAPRSRLAAEVADAAESSGIPLARSRISFLAAHPLAASSHSLPPSGKAKNEVAALTDEIAALLGI